MCSPFDQHAWKKIEQEVIVFGRAFPIVYQVCWQINKIKIKKLLLKKKVFCLGLIFHVE
jgi:hypothetical protein